MKNLVARLRKSEKGQGMVEYGLILALIAVVVITALSAMGGSLKTKFEGIKTNLDTPPSTTTTTTGG